MTFEEQFPSLKGMASTTEMTYTKDGGKHKIRLFDEYAIEKACIDKQRVKQVIAQKDYRKDNCKHEYIYNRMIYDELRETVKYVITCKKCFYEPPEGYVPDNRTEGCMPEFFNDCDFFKNSDDMTNAGTAIIAYLKLKKINKMLCINDEEE